ncbi:MAG TPA: asparagine synthase-related protein [Acidimicrobiales bacterium]
MRLAHVALEPTSDSSAGIAIVGDIRLDDRAELLAGVGDQTRREVGDPELVLAAYRRWGDRFVEHLTGDFAFALWDSRKRLVTCARDPFGTRPFYYHLSPSTFAFASDPEAVLRLPGVPRRLNPAALVDYLDNRYDDEEAGVWRDVSRLPAGTTLTVGADLVRRRRFWHPGAVPEVRLGSDAEYEEAFRVALTDAVRARLPATRAGVSLSGGLDSSSLACVAGPLYRAGRLATFSARFALDPGSDEWAYATTAAAQAGADLHACRPEDTSPLADWSGSAWSGPAPGCSPQGAVVRAVTGAATERGVSVLLTGYGGDSVVSHGAAYLTELAASGHPLRFLAEARALGRRHGRPVGPLVRRFGLRPFVPSAVVRTRRRLLRRDVAVGGVAALLRPEVVRGLRPEGLAGERRPPRTARLAHEAEVAGGFLPYALETFFHTDAVVGVERRHPFLDRRLAELCLGLPGDQKLRDGWTRSIMRRALVGIVPDAIRERPGKADLTGPFLRGLLGPDRPGLEELVARPGVVTEWVDPAALTALWHRCVAERGADDCFTLWRVAVLSRWLTHHGIA